MNPTQRSLWQRIEAHVLDHPTATLPFTLRLAKENRWPLGFAQRVVAEYRRFAFLAIAAGHPVSPPDTVDQAWHLHLLYTQDYWEEFCPKTLGQSLHHGPTRGGRAETGKFADWYARTLASYRQFFGEPPADIWPEHPSHPVAVRVDTHMNWIIPKPSFTRFWKKIAALRPTAVAVKATTLTGGAPIATALAVALFFLPQRALAADGSIWPFNLRGPDFLVFFAWFAPLMLALAYGLRWYLSQPSTFGTAPEILEPYEAAHLAGGEKRVLAAIFASLRHRLLITVDKNKIKRTEKAAPGQLPLLEQVTLAAIDGEGMKPRDIHAAVAHALSANAATLEAAGLVLSPSSAGLAWGAGLFLGLVPATVGGIKVIVGLSLGRPVSYLVILSIIAFVLALVIFLRRPRVTARGKAALAKLTAQHSNLERLDTVTLQEPGAPSLLPLAVGLFGFAALQNTGLASMQDDLRLLEARNLTGNTTGGCGSTYTSSSCGSSDSSSGGSSCGGGGDGGGGGCGGCGGGGD